MPVALALLPAIIIALLCVLLYLAVQQAVKVIGMSMPDWHIPGLGSIRDAVVNAGTSVFNATASYLDGQVRPLAHALAAPVIVFRRLFDRYLGTLQTVYNTLHVIVSVKLPAVYHAAINWADHVYNLAVAFAAARIAALASVVELRYRQAIGWADHVYNLAVAFAAARIAALALTVDQLYHQALAYADAAVSGLARTVEQLYRQAIAYADAAAKAAFLAAISTIDASVGAICLPLWPEVAGAISRIEAAAAGAFADQLARLKGISRVSPGTLTGEIAGTLALVTTLAEFTADCVIPNCRNLSQVGRDLQAIFGLVEEGLIVALLAEAASDPAGTAHVVRDAIGGTLGSAVGDLRQTVGV
jgi:hypothetical protein